MNKSKSKRDEVCEAIGNRTEPITEVTCPPNVKNPGLYFGAVLGYEQGKLETAGEVERLYAVLNRIALWGMGPKAYTSDFTNDVNGLVRKVLSEQRRG